jgi:hypothetical protein
MMKKRQKLEIFERGSNPEQKRFLDWIPTKTRKRVAKICILIFISDKNAKFCNVFYVHLNFEVFTRGGKGMPLSRTEIFVSPCDYSGK